MENLSNWIWIIVAVLWFGAKILPRLLRGKNSQTKVPTPQIPEPDKPASAKTSRFGLWPLSGLRHSSELTGAFALRTSARRSSPAPDRAQIGAQQAVPTINSSI